MFFSMKKESASYHLNLMAGPRCSMMHRFSRKACVVIKNGWLKAIKVALSLSQRRVHNVMFEVDFCFQSLTTTFSRLALDYTLPRSSLTPLQIDAGANTIPLSL